MVEKKPTPKTRAPKPPPAPDLFIYIYYRETPIRRRERWGIRVVATGNHAELMTSEKYVNHDDALATAKLIADAQNVKIVDPEGDDMKVLPE